MYLEHFGLGSDPFSLRPHLRFLYDSTAFEETMSHLVYGLENGEDLTLITGEIGTGKTLALQNLIQTISSVYTVALINVTQINFDELLKLLIGQLELTLPPHPDRGDMINLLLTDMRSRQARRSKVLLVIDEAQDLDKDSLEGVRLLLNLAQPGDQVLQIVLSGQLTLAAVLESPELAQLKQRIRVHYRLETLGDGEVAAYINHRMMVAGCDHEVFTRGALRRISELSGGVPRLVNALADHALLAAFVDGKKKVSENHVEEIDMVRDPNIVQPAATVEADSAPAAPSAQPATPAPARPAPAIPSVAPSVDPVAAVAGPAESPVDAVAATPSLATRRARRRGFPFLGTAVALVVAAAFIWLFVFGGLEQLRGGISATAVDEPFAGGMTPNPSAVVDSAIDTAAVFAADIGAGDATVAIVDVTATAGDAVSEADSVAVAADVADPAEIGGGDESGTPEAAAEPVGVVERPGPGYYVHVGSFMHSSRAVWLRDSLESDYDVLLWRKTIGGSVWYRVFVGPYADKEAAGAADEILRGEPGIIYTLIHRIR